MCDRGDQTGIYDSVLGHSAGALNTDNVKEWYERIIKGLFPKVKQPNNSEWVKVGLG